jgi:hypothetical protein
MTLWKFRDRYRNLNGNIRALRLMLSSQCNAAVLADGIDGIIDEIEKYLLQLAGSLEIVGI